MAIVAIIVRPLNVVGTIILARLLDPSDFGAVALAMVLLGTSYMFIGLGMGSALIHSNADHGKVAFQTFVVTVITGAAYIRGPEIECGMAVSSSRRCRCRCLQWPAAASAVGVINHCS